MDYEETLSYLFSQLPMFQRMGAAAYKANLNNTLQLARMCENPEEGMKCIHIAGTNGKGSTAHALASVFQSCGYKTGLMTSPHYKDFRERIKVNGEFIDSEYIVDWVDRYKSRFERIQPSFFELTVLMGFNYFKAQKVDIAIIETGMGGRLDSTNIVEPELSIITPIGFDHQQFLGDTLEKIALEKAGIIKHGIPVLIAQGNEVILPVFTSVAESRNAELVQVNASSIPITSDLKGSYQQRNMATVLEAVKMMRMRGWNLPEEKVNHGLNHIIPQTGFMGRWQIIQEAGPRIIADAAHNVHGMETLMQSLKEEQYETLHLVMAMVSDKDVKSVLSLLPSDAHYHFSQAKLLRAMPAEELCAKASELGLKGKIYLSLEEALEGAKKAARKADLILITGSIFTVAELI
jgi:dihydrofolate synthase/folylpolyglutamate synthase